MLSPGTQTCAHSCGHMQKARVHLQRADVVSGARHEHTIIHLKHSRVHPRHAACGLIKRMRALKHLFLRRKQTRVPAEFTAKNPSIQGPGEACQTSGRQRETQGRQMNLSTQRAVPGNERAVPVSWWTGSFVSIYLPVCLGGRIHLSPFVSLYLSSLGGRIHLSPFVSLHLSPVVSQPGCLARLSWWTGSFVSLCLLSSVVSQPGCLARLSGCFVSLCLPSFRLSWDVFICLPLSPFICLALSGNRRVTLNEFRTPHSKLFGENMQKGTCRNMAKTGEQRVNGATKKTLHPPLASGSAICSVL